MRPALGVRRSSAALTAAAAGRKVHSAAGAQPAVRLVVTLQPPGHEAPSPVLVSGSAQLAGRVGAVQNSSSWLGSTRNWTLPADEGWSSPARPVPTAAVAADFPEASPALQMPPVHTGPEISAAEVDAAHVAGAVRHVYRFPVRPCREVPMCHRSRRSGGQAMVVGTATLKAGSWSGKSAPRLAAAAGALTQLCRTGHHSHRVLRSPEQPWAVRAAARLRHRGHGRLPHRGGGRPGPHSKDFIAKERVGWG